MELKKIQNLIVHIILYVGLTGCQIGFSSKFGDTKTLFMLKKAVFIGLFLFLILSVVNILSGIILWRLHKNYQPKKGHIDAPYIYFQQKPTGSYKNGFEIDSSITLTKEPNEFRVLLLGGSVANVIGSLAIVDSTILLHSTSASYLQQLLQQQYPSKKITVLNGSIASFVTEQEFIAFQKFLQFYHPDLVIGLHGYNDIESFRLTHNDLNEQFAPAPMFYLSGTVAPPFKMVENFQRNYSFSNIFKGYYSHIENASFFTLKKAGLVNYDFENLEHISDSRLKFFAEQHFYVCKDLYDFCQAKKIEYINFLQPVRFYKQKDSTYYGNNSSKVFPMLSKLYYYMETNLDCLPNNISLTSLNQVKLQYFDDCHLSPQGYKFLTETLAMNIIDKINSKSLTVGN